MDDHGVGGWGQVACGRVRHAGIIRINARTKGQSRPEPSWRRTSTQTRQDFLPARQSIVPKEKDMGSKRHTLKLLQHWALASSIAQLRTTPLPLLCRRIAASATSASCVFFFFRDNESRDELASGVIRAFIETRRCPLPRPDHHVGGQDATGSSTTHRASPRLDRRCCLPRMAEPWPAPGRSRHPARRYGPSGQTSDTQGPQRPRQRRRLFARRQNTRLRLLRSHRPPLGRRLGRDSGHPQGA